MPLKIYLKRAYFLFMFLKLRMNQALLIPSFVVDTIKASKYLSNEQ